MCGQRTTLNRTESNVSSPCTVWVLVHTQVFSMCEETPLSTENSSAHAFLFHLANIDGVLHLWGCGVLVDSVDGLL